MIYPKITKKNFEDFTEKHVQRGREPRFIGIEIPKNLNQFKEFTKAIYGIELEVECSAYPEGTFGAFNNMYQFTHFCKYKIIGKTHDVYSKKTIMKLWDKKYGQYQGLIVLLNTCFGELMCGGVAQYHYGQTRCDKATWERVKNWDQILN